MMDLEKIKIHLKRILSQKRFEHSLGVADEAVRLAKHYGADPQQAYVAGLVHDCAKEIPADKASGMLSERYGVTADQMSLHMPRLLHGVLGACMAQSEYGIYDPVVLDAVRYHTTGKADMGLLAKIIYIADYIEPTRDFEGVEELRELAYKNLDLAIIQGIDFTIRDLIERKMPLHPDTIHARNFLLLHQEENE